MPRNVNGVYTLVAGNPVITGTVVESEWANTTMPDVGNELTDSLSRSGKGGMLAALRGVNGSKTIPAFSFSSAIQTGTYLPAAGDLRWTVGGVDKFRLTTGDTRPQYWSVTGGAFVELADKPAVDANTTAIAANTVLANTKVAKTSDTGSAVIPSGTEAQRDVAPVAGYFRFNVDLGKPEIYTGTNWVLVSGDVVDATTVSAAGALMDSELANITAVKTLNQQVNTASAVTHASLNTTGSITENGVGLFGIGQTWQDVTGSRTAGVVYTNTTDKPLMVNVVLAQGSTSGRQFRINGSVTSTLATDVNTNSAFVFVIPNGQTYEFLANSFSAWYELR